MKIGIEAIATYLPEARVNNRARLEKFGIDEEFLTSKIGVLERSVKASDEETSDLCVKAFQALQKKMAVNVAEIEAVIVVTQNPDYSLPHTSAIVHGKLGLPSHCATFDISLGCSGFVYALSVLSSFMEANGMKRGLIFTADPYSKVLNEEDKNTSLLFGDGSAVTLLSDRGAWVPGKFSFGTLGDRHRSLIVEEGVLSMNGRDIFNFAALNIPKDVEKVLELNGITKESVDQFLFHSGSRYIVDVLAQRMDLPEKKVPFGVEKYGNTISSSIPFLLERVLENSSVRTLLISGFGVGLSWSTGMLFRKEHK